MEKMLPSAAAIPSSCNRIATIQTAPPARLPMTKGTVVQSSLSLRQARTHDLRPALNLAVPAVRVRYAHVGHQTHENDVEHDEGQHNGRALERISDRLRNLAGFLDRAAGTHRTAGNRKPWKEPPARIVIKAIRASKRTMTQTPCLTFSGIGWAKVSMT